MVLAVPEHRLLPQVVPEEQAHQIISSAPKRNMAVAAVAVRTTTELTPMQSHLAQAVVETGAVLRPHPSTPTPLLVCVVVEVAQVVPEMADDLMAEAAVTALC